MNKKAQVMQTPKRKIINVKSRVDLIELKRNDNIKYKEKSDENWKVVTFLCRGGKTTGQYKNWFNVKDRNTGAVFGLKFRQCNRMAEM